MNPSIKPLPKQTIGSPIAIGEKTWPMVNHFRTILARHFKTFKQASDALGICAADMSRYSNGIRGPREWRLNHWLAMMGETPESFKDALDPPSAPDKLAKGARKSAKRPK